jgi:hypothetical protein
LKEHDQRSYYEEYVEDYLLEEEREAKGPTTSQKSKQRYSQAKAKVSIH